MRNPVSKSDAFLPLLKSRGKIFLERRSVFTVILVESFDCRRWPTIVLPLPLLLSAKRAPSTASWSRADVPAMFQVGRLYAVQANGVNKSATMTDIRRRQVVTCRE